MPTFGGHPLTPGRRDSQIESRLPRGAASAPPPHVRKSSLFSFSSQNYASLYFASFHWPLDATGPPSRRLHSCPRTGPLNPNPGMGLHGCEQNTRPVFRGLCPEFSPHVMMPSPPSRTTLPPPGRSRQRPQEEANLTATRIDARKSVSVHSRLFCRYKVALFSPAPIPRPPRHFRHAQLRHVASEFRPRTEETLSRVFIHLQA